MCPRSRPMHWNFPESPEIIRTRDALHGWGPRKRPAKPGYHASGSEGESNILITLYYGNNCTS
jgi:hypothetical protein